MSYAKPFVLSIAGFDPSAGAGILADIKTFEMLGTYGLGVCTSTTFQNEDEFDGVEWISFESIQRQMEVVFRKYAIAVVKIGLIESFTVLSCVVNELQRFNSRIRIIWDPVLKASAGFDFHQEIDSRVVENVLSKIFLVTPNLPEAIKLAGHGSDAVASAIALNKHCNVYLKGGHRTDDLADDILCVDSSRYVVAGKKILTGDKHGSGCVLSAAIAANLAKGISLQESCEHAKKYVNGFLKSSKGLLGYHRN